MTSLSCEQFRNGKWAESPVVWFGIKPSTSLDKYQGQCSHNSLVASLRKCRLGSRWASQNLNSQQIVSTLSHWCLFCGGWPPVVIDMRADGKGKQMWKKSVLEIRETEELQIQQCRWLILTRVISTFCPSVSLKASWNINLYTTFTGILTERNINLYFTFTGILTEPFRL